MPPSAIGPDLTDQNDTSNKPKATEAAIESHLTYRDSGQPFTSNRPNQALLWALIDDSELGAEEHKQALAIVEGWRPQPWKGMVWHALSGLTENGFPDRVWISPTVDMVWNGRDWEPVTETPVIYKALVTPSPSKVSAKLTAKITQTFNDGAGSTIEAIELNQAYEAYQADPDGEEDNLFVTIAAFVRSKWRMFQARKLLANAPDIATQIDDIFSDFVVYLRGLMEKKQYTHVGKFDGWIAYKWARHFFPDQQKEIYDYINSTRFVNNADKSAPGYVFEDYHVNTSNLITDGLGVGDPGILCKAVRKSDGAVKTFRLTADILLREIGRPNSYLGQLHDDVKAMLRRIAEDASPEVIMREFDISESTYYRRLKEARDAGQRMLQDGAVPEANDTATPQAVRVDADPHPEATEGTCVPLACGMGTEVGK